MTRYSDLLRDPRWQRKRLEVMQRDGFACRECGDTTTTLNVHHTYYAKGRMPWEYENESLRTLCQPCHGDVSAQLAELQRHAGQLDAMRLTQALAYVRALDVAQHWSDWSQCGSHTPRIPIAGYVEFSAVAAALEVDEGLLYDAQGDSDSLGWEEYRAAAARWAARPVEEKR